ncbi:uncharacterized protein CXQ87_004916 [Candidozyma duobushaemuli]|uniref:U4/U6.U5 tri-snRNP-associated protein 1 n=2 Tax=Candidozyma TaxID=3303203 RepID=A0ABX8IBB7_9ASCO|nr:uncharacterized protein CXQ87_004916 [[Candida] duobushaemulonis]PVH16621.1 hypothetical protein CXQ87_004916 [[Candida] duobushaemulonis]QWU90377.1 hypothetical protein CA3LBN_004738 [[Candida] haemuloni]
MVEEISLSIEETNRLRAQIGLPLLPVEKQENPKKTVSGKDELSIEETNKLRASLGLKPIVVEEPSKEPIPEKSALMPKQTTSNDQYKVDTSSKLFYNDAGSDWLENVGKGKKAEKAAETEVSKESERIAVAHTASALSDVKDGEVFTLEDQNVLDGEEERMVNEEIAKAEKLRKTEAEKRKIATLKFGVRFEEDEEDEADELAQVSGTTILLPQKQNVEPSVKTGTTKMEALFDDIDEPKPAAVKFKKKSKKKSSSKKRELDNDEELETLQPMVTEELKFEAEDGDDEIQSVLAKNREKQQKKRKLLTPEQLAQEIQSHQRIDLTEKTGGVVFDGTSDFLSSIGQAVEEDGVEEDVKEEVEKEIEEQVIETQEEIVPRSEEKTGPEEQEAPSKPKFGSMAATLSYLRGNNMVSAESAMEKGARKQQEQRIKEAELQRIAISIEERSVKSELESDSSYKRLSKEEQDSTLDRILNERLVAKGLVEVPKGRYSSYNSDRLSSYNPQVNLKYKDQDGNELDSKQAFKQLSHKYHGTAPKHKKKKMGNKSEMEHVIN